jgi:hypothetical protein
MPGVPGGIPEDIFVGGLDHRTPHKGDHGVWYKEYVPWGPDERVIKPLWLEEEKG